MRSCGSIWMWISLGCAWGPLALQLGAGEPAARPAVAPDSPAPASPPATTDGDRRDDSESRSGYAGHYTCKTFSGKDRDLCIAVSDIEPDRVKSLLAAGANINARSNRSPTKGMTMVMLAVWHRWDREALQLLLDAGADVNAKDDRGNTAMILATETSPVIDRAEMELLIQAGADINAKGVDGMTALMHAAMRGHTPIVQCLLEAGADANLKDARGWTALMHASRIYAGRPEVVSLLIKSGADVNARHNCGGTALSHACYYGHVEVVETLLAAGANVNTKDRAGWTPLLCASASGQTPLVKRLIAAGADIRATDRMGRTALDAASEGHHPQTAAVLREAAAPPQSPARLPPPGLRPRRPRR